MGLSAKHQKLPEAELEVGRHYWVGHCYRNSAPDPARAPDLEAAHVPPNKSSCRNSLLDENPVSLFVLFLVFTPTQTRLIITSTIIFASFRSLETHELTTSTNTLLDAAIVVVWQAIELSYSLMAVTIAALKSFTENLNTGFGHGELVRVHGNSQAYKMSDLSAGSKTAKSKGLTATVGSIGILEQPRRPPPTATAKPERDDMKLRPESAHTSATISSPGRRSMSHSYSVKGNADSGAADCNSDEHIIMQEIQYSIRFDEAPLCQDHP